MSLDHAPDLTVHPPRSARVRLGNLVILPRMLDKCRATLVGRNGEYHYACPLDQRLLEFLGVDAEALKFEVGKGLGDRALLKWLLAHGKHPRSEMEIAQWSAWMDDRPCPSDRETVEFFFGGVHAVDPEIEDITSWFKLLDFDDFISFGGRA